ncbi:J protein JJJ2 [Lingula anatina]|uniref:J protein JJJ2 n=1 Tax=Lingula anatina TaxID=7574 RepID=A0A2R2MJM3_LINAN|nr:J protein JJJ2 [Lingula anatina]|eukprot:XP_023930404.1 J protein JJJ2 [Lingula anatina]
MIFIARENMFRHKGFLLIKGHVSRSNELHQSSILLSMQGKDLYAVLGISKNATKDEIRKAYLDKVKKNHPDVNKNKNAHLIFTQINKAYETLRNDTSRRDYDRSMSFQSFSSSTVNRNRTYADHRDYGSKYRPYAETREYKGGGPSSRYQNPYQDTHYNTRRKDEHFWYDFWEEERGGPSSRYQNPYRDAYYNTHRKDEHNWYESWGTNPNEANEDERMREAEEYFNMKWAAEELRRRKDRERIWENIERMKAQMNASRDSFWHGARSTGLGGRHKQKATQAENSYSKTDFSDRKSEKNGTRRRKDYAILGDILFIAYMICLVGLWYFTRDARNPEKRRRRESKSKERGL